MTLTLDIVVAGCQTDCRHCYVNGGRATSRMKSENILLVLEYLKSSREELASRFSRMSPYFDFEPFSHPDIVVFLREFVKTGFSPVMNQVPTTGIALVSRGDRESVFAAAKEAGVTEFVITIHGPLEIHEASIRRHRAVEIQKRFVEIADSYGFIVSANLMISDEMVENFDDTMELINYLAIPRFRFTIPSFEPVEALRTFSSHRPRFEHLRLLAQSPSARDASNFEILEDPAVYARESWLQKAESFRSWDDVRKAMPQWVFVSVQPDLQVFSGNGNMLIRKIGAIGDADQSHLTESLMSLKANYSIFRYPETSLPSLDRVIDTAIAQPRETVFPDVWDMLSYSLDTIVNPTAYRDTSG